MNNISKTKGMRSPYRRWWYMHYRQLRIIRRECAKQYEDVLLFGSGFVMITNEPDYIRHVPLENVMIKEENYAAERSKYND